MRSLILLPTLLAACSQPAEDRAAPAPRTESIAGLYEGSGRLTMPNRMCLTGAGADTRFGLVMSSDGRKSCTARGRVRQSGSTLRLAIDGDPACSLTASLTGTGLQLQAAQGAECGYYCGAGMEFRPASFRKGGATQADIRKVVDLAGDPLC